QVALRTAACARANALRRRRHENRSASALGEDRTEPGKELVQVVHEEIERLPERYRAPVILCDLEGRTHEQAARHLGWPVGTVKSRQARARERLRNRLRRRGFAPSAILAGGPLRPVGFDPSVLSLLIDSTTRGAIQFLHARWMSSGAAVVLAQG